MCAEFEEIIKQQQELKVGKEEEAPECMRAGKSI